MGSVILQAGSPRFLVIGAGSRGHAYARAVTASTNGTIVAVAEPNDYKRNEFGQKYIWANNAVLDGQAFQDWKDFILWEQHRRADSSADTKPRIDGVFICTLDETHASIIEALAPLNLHIMCEKPLALSMSDCLKISRALAPYPAKVFSIGHVLRYSPHNIVLRDLLVSKKAIGEIVSIEHTEPIGWWHFSHSYVRGNWRRATPEGVGSLLTKSCHDIDFIMWLMCSPSPLTGAEPHLPSTITSSGALTHFRNARKPRAAGSATNCTKCALATDCNYSAVKVYRDKFLRERKDTGWPVQIVVPEIEDIVADSGWTAAEDALVTKLSEDYGTDASDKEKASRSWYGRCVYEADNNVMDEQLVTLTWDEEPVNDQSYGRGPKQALFHMTYPTRSQCERRGKIYGSEGEITYDSRSISVYTFKDEQIKTHDIPKQNAEVEKSHGGGDWGLAGAFVRAVEAVESGTMNTKDAQRAYVGCDLEECIRSHAVVFAAEDARMHKTVVDYRDWWSRSEMLTETVD